MSKFYAKQFAVNDTVPNFTFHTAFTAKNSWHEALEQSLTTALVFLRYYGCTICQLDLHELAENHKTIVNESGQLFVVLQSSAENLAKEITQETFPFTILCDPEADLYRQFGIVPAANMLKLAGAKTLAKIAKSTAKGYKHGAYEGEELQLPAVFIMNSAAKLCYVHYGKSAGDIPPANKLAQLMNLP